MNNEFAPIVGGENIEITIEPCNNEEANNEEANNNDKKKKKTQDKEQKEQKDQDFTNTCPTCNEKYNKQKNKKNLCYCGMEICRKCMKSYILSKEENPKCFQCNTGWTRSFLAENLENKFITGDYKKHREKNIFDYERTLLPETQIEVEKVVEEENLRKVEAQYDAKIQELMTERRQKRKEYYDKYYPHAQENQRGTGRERREFIRKCPNGDCMGFLSSSHKCGLCQIWACPECREIKGLDKDAPHQCNPQILESVKLLEKDSKPCPKCASMIFKLEGCDQMWCTNCQTSFSWIRGTIINGHVHNPHYFEWMRLNGGTANIERAGEQEQNCQDRNLTNRVVNRFLTSIRDRFPDLHKDMSNVMRRIIHIRHEEVTRFEPPNRNDNLIYRIQYMRKQISEEKFKTIIQMKEKRNDKNTHITNLLQMFISLETDIIYRLFDDLTVENIEKCRAEMDKLREYTNGQFQTISRNFQCVCYEINKEWKFSSNTRGPSA